MPKQKMLWCEDECTRGMDGHEYIADAWKRIFGTVYDPSKTDKVIDHGDMIERRFGKISVLNVYCGWYEILEDVDETPSASAAVNG